MRENHRHACAGVGEDACRGVRRRFRILAVIDDCTRENLGVIADASISGSRGARELDALIRLYGRPASIVSDNGNELTTRAMLEW